jgi:hypothetical protein
MSIAFIQFIPPWLFCLKVMPVAKRKCFEFVKSNKEAGAPQSKMHLADQTEILFMYVYGHSNIHTCKAAFLLVSFPMPSASYAA